MSSPMGRQLLRCSGKRSGHTGESATIPAEIVCYCSGEWALPTGLARAGLWSLAFAEQGGSSCPGLSGLIVLAS